MSKSKLSVITTTYNSEIYIQKTILAVLEQNIDNLFEYIIYDDASVDATISVIEGIQKTHKNGSYIRLFKQSVNQGVMRNFFDAVKKTNGDYIAFCDSDDLWMDNRKLFKQMEYLDNNPSVSIVYHGTTNVLENGVSENDSSKFDEPLNRVLYRPQTSTMMVRGELRDLINPNVINEAKGPQNDQYLRLLLSKIGGFRCLRDIEPNQRVVRSNSIYSTVDELKRKELSLQSWKTFYKYHKHTHDEQYLRNKVLGFMSRINWLKFEYDRNPSQFFTAILFDIRNGLLMPKTFKLMRKPILKAYQLTKRN